MMNIDPKVAVELLEIIKFLDDELKKYIPLDFIDMLVSIRDKEYVFKINKDINLFENQFMEETIDLLEYLFKDIERLH